MVNNYLFHKNYYRTFLELVYFVNMVCPGCRLVLNYEVVMKFVLENVFPLPLWYLLVFIFSFEKPSSPIIFRPGKSCRSSRKHSDAKSLISSITYSAQERSFVMLSNAPTVRWLYHGLRAATK